MTLRSSRMAALFLSALERAGLSVASAEESPETPQPAATSELAAELAAGDEAPFPRRALVAGRHARRRDWALACYRNSWIPPEG